MRVIKNVTSTLLIAGMASIAYAWSPRAAAEPLNQPEMASPAQQDQDAPKQDQAKPSKPAKETKPARPAHPQPSEKQPTKVDKNQPRDAKDQPRQDDRTQPRPAQAQQSHGQAAGSHGRISDKNYQAHFGQPHSFTVRRVVTTTRIVPNQTRFVYGGYNFIFLAPWPSEWLLTDDCYIDYVDGQYVLIDLSHPGMTIALEIVD